MGVNKHQEFFHASIRKKTYRQSKRDRLMRLDDIVRIVGEAIAMFGVAVIVIGTMLATLHFASQVIQKDDQAYPRYRKNLGKTLLLGLEILIAGDIISTVAIEPTIERVVVLAIIVIIRTFLSWSIEVEIEGRWPWQGHDSSISS
jgi:uncharacterized membrane protein